MKTVSAVRFLAVALSIGAAHAAAADPAPLTSEPRGTYEFTVRESGTSMREANQRAVREVAGKCLQDGAYTDQVTYSRLAGWGAANGQYFVHAKGVCSFSEIK